MAPPDKPLLILGVKAAMAEVKIFSSAAVLNLARDHT